MAGTLAKAEPKHYVWWFPGSPVKVHLDLQVVHRLRQRLGDAQAGIPEEGLLLGRTGGGATEILDFLPVDDAPVTDMVAALPPARKNSLIGYYRTENTGNFQLNANDISLAEKCLAKPHHVFLLIQSGGYGPPNATFFFHDGSRMTDFPFLEFPFDPSLLAIEEQNRIQRAHPAAAAKPVALPSPGPASHAAVFPRIKRSVLLKAALAIGCVALAFIVGILFNSRSFRDASSRVWNEIFRPPATPSTPSPAPSPHSLALHAVRQNSDVQLSWNRESSLIAAATSGVISIQDGEAKRLVLLDAQQVHDGSLLYSPASEQITIQFSVTTPSETANESVIVILPKSGKAQTYALSASKAPSTPYTPPPPASESAPLAKALRKFTTPSSANGAPSPAPPALQYPDAPAMRINPVNSAVVPTGLPQAPILPPPAPKPAPQQAAPVPPPATPPAATQVAGQQPVPPVVTYEPPVPLVKVTPSFPREIHELNTRQTLVQVKVSIDQNGKVVQAKAIPLDNVSIYLLNAATNAARLWKFQPARRNHEPIPSEMTVQFVFRQ